MRREKVINLYYHETFFNALRNETAMKRWDQEEILLLGISFAAGTRSHDVGRRQHRGPGNTGAAQTGGVEAKHFVGCLCR